MFTFAMSRILFLLQGTVSSDTLVAPLLPGGCYLEKTDLLSSCCKRVFFFSGKNVMLANKINFARQLGCWDFRSKIWRVQIKKPSYLIIFLPVWGRQDQSALFEEKEAGFSWEMRRLFICDHDLFKYYVYVCYTKKFTQNYLFKSITMPIYHIYVFHIPETSSNKSFLLWPTSDKPFIWTIGKEEFTTCCAEYSNK